MEPFFVSPAEALITGLCLEDYLLLREDKPETCFFSVISSRVYPFFPCPLDAGRRKPILEQEFPPDAQWFQSEKGRTGISPSHPGLLFGVDENGPYCERPLLHHFFPILLTSYVEDLVAISKEERQAFDALKVSDWEIIKYLHAFLRGDRDVEPQKPPSPSEPKTEEDSKAIERRLEELVEHNECQRPFRIGRLFGGLVGCIRRYREEDRVHGLEVYPRFRERWKELSCMDEVVKSTIADTALSNCGLLFLNEFQHCVRSLKELNTGNVEAAKRVLREEMPRIAKARERYLASMDQVDCLLWVAFGEVLGRFREIDAEARDADAAHSLPRELALHDDRTDEDIAALIRDAGKRLGGDSRPAHVMAGLSGVIEAIAKRMWHDEFKQPQCDGGVQRISINDLLTSKQRNGDAVEARFAALALTFRRHYRNPAEHEFDSFYCLPEEARLYVYGVRVLFELYKHRLEIVGR